MVLSNIACVVFYGLIAAIAIAGRAEARLEARDADLYEDAVGWEEEK